MKKQPNFSWNVYMWNVNQDDLEVYDVVPLLMDKYKALKKDRRPKTRAELSEFLKSEARYYFWGKCECEIIIHCWPKFKNDRKVDIYEQLMLNWDAFVDKFWSMVSHERRSNG